MEAEAKNIVIAEDHDVFREGLKIVLSKMPQIKSVFGASNGVELLTILENKKIDIVLMDIEMPCMDGVEAAKIIKKKYPQTRIVALTLFNDMEYLSRIISVGVNAFLPKNADKYEIMRAIDMVIENKCALPININLLINNSKFKFMKTTKILIVDDDIDIITVLETILSKKGYQVITAMNKVEGIKKIREEKPDLAILDVMMTTHFEGFELAKEITDDPELKNIPVLMQTSVEVLVTTRPDVQEMARDFRKNPGFKDLHVLLVKDMVSGNAGIDYLSESGQTIWFPVAGFLSKPVDTGKIITELERVLAKNNSVC